MMVLGTWAVGFVIVALGSLALALFLLFFEQIMALIVIVAIVSAITYGCWSFGDFVLSLLT